MFPFQLSSFLPYFLLFQAVQLAMDRKDRERELVSAMLPQLCPSVISGGLVLLYCSDWYCWTAS